MNALITACHTVGQQGVSCSPRSYLPPPDTLFLYTWSFSRSCMTSVPYIFSYILAYHSTQNQIADDGLIINRNVHTLSFIFSSVTLCFLTTRHVHCALSIFNIYICHAQSIDLRSFTKQRKKSMDPYIAALLIDALLNWVIIHSIH